MIRAREKIKALEPDVLTLMSSARMDGLQFLDLMRLRPMPVELLVVRAAVPHHVERPELGAIDF